MFAGWQTFYQMAAEVAATLIGLMFIVATLSAGRPSSGAVQGQRLYTTPTVFHLTTVLVIGGLALAPEGSGSATGVLMTGWALFGLGYATWVGARIARSTTTTHWSDFWCYGAAPAVTYLALAATNVMVWRRVLRSAHLAALCLMVLLVLTIRNAWDLVTWLAPRRDPETPPPEG
jgi:hypothetical protein